MALVKRISRLFSADIHAVLDQLEDPESVLKQAVREMEEEVARQEQRDKWLEKEIDATTSRIQSLEAAVTEIDRKLDTCFEHGNEALARRLTRRKLETRKLVQRVADKRATMQDERTDLATTLAGNRDQLDSLQQKADLLATPGSARLSTYAEESLAQVDDDEVEVAFLREKEARAAR
jgi:phage shock protein A